MAWLKRFVDRKAQWRKLKGDVLPPPDRSVARLAQILDEQNRYISRVSRQR
jgi:hypothetical protein